jgi:hypothetical protein
MLRDAQTNRSLPAGGAPVWRLSQYPPKLVQPWKSEGGRQAGRSKIDCVQMNG